MRFLSRFFVLLFALAGFQGSAVANQIKGDPCHVQGRIALMVEAGRINPTSEVAVMYISGIEVMFQKGADHAFEYDLKYDEVLAAACLIGEPQTISVDFFRLLYGKERFDKFNSDPT